MGFWEFRVSGFRVLGFFVLGFRASLGFRVLWKHRRLRRFPLYSVPNMQYLVLVTLLWDTNQKIGFPKKVGI